MNSVLRPWRSGVLLSVLGVLIVSLFPASPTQARSTGEGEGLELVAEIPLGSGSHLETVTIGGREYAFVSDIEGLGELHTIDITDPEKPRIKATIPCNGNQGNVQISHDKKTLVIGIDARSSGGCVPMGKMGFVTVDISDPVRPRVLGFAENTKGSHSLAAHPTKPFVYNGEGFPEAPGAMQVWSIKNPAKPKLVKTVDTGIHSPHDLAFNKSGTMMATANAVNLHLMDTRDPSDPKIVHTTQCPGCLHTHEARFTPDGKRLIVNDEYPAAACPGGGIYFYDIVGTEGAESLELTGAYTIEDLVINASSAATTKCTPHIFDISADGTKMAATWHEGGLRYLDIGETAGVTVGPHTVVPGGPVQLGWYLSDGAYTFSAKLHKGPYIFVVDSNIGFQVFKIAPGK